MRRSLLAVLALLLGVLFGGAVVVGANAAPPEPPQSGDPRATAFPGNVTTCAAAGLPGTEIDVTSHIADGTYIDITAIPSGHVVTGVVVKGGPAYNKYPNLGPLPWKGLHSPLVPSGMPAAISHWFVCATRTTTSTTTTSTTTTTKSTTTTTKTTSSTSKTSSTTASSSTTGSSSSTTTSPASSTTSSGVVMTTSASSATPVAQATNRSGLAYTGFEGWPYLLGAALLLFGGVGALFLARRRRG